MSFTVCWYRPAVFVLAIGISCCSIGCGVVATDKPLYGTHETVFDPQLLGIWVGASTPGHPGDVLIVARGDGNRYRLSSLPLQPPDPSTRVEMDLVRFGKYEYLFLDVPNWSGTLLFPAYRVRVLGREMRMSLLNEPQFVEELKKHPGMLAYTEEAADSLPLATTRPAVNTQPAPTTQPTTWPAPTNVVLTDAPEKIRRLLVEHEDDPNWFAEVLVLHRITPPARR